MSHRVLVVDNEPLVRRLVEVNLLRAGYEVGIATDGEEALEKLHAERPDLMVLDVMMPRMDGFELLDQLRKDEMLADLPVIILSARSHDQDIFEAWRRGVSMYLTKPFKPVDLLTTTRSIFQAREFSDGLLPQGRKVAAPAYV
jgi:DNA-binding response OmpR family regulator